MDFWERMGMAEWRNWMLIVVLRPRRLYMIVSYENTICGPTSAVSITPIDLLGVFGPYQDLTTGQKSKFIGLYPLESTFTFIISSIFIVRATILRILLEPLMRISLFSRLFVINPYIHFSSTSISFWCFMSVNDLAKCNPICLNWATASNYTFGPCGLYLWVQL